MTSSVVIPAEIVGLRLDFLHSKVEEHRNAMKAEYERYLEEEVRSLPDSVLRLTLREFLLLSNIFDRKERQAACPPTASKSATKRPRIEAADSGRVLMVDGTRRVTRSMTRNSSMYIRDTQTVAVPETPRLHPMLPETPAVLRNAIKLAKESDNAAGYKRPVRIARSTIRAAPSLDGKGIFKAPAGVQKNTKLQLNGDAAAQDSTVVSLELSDGKVLDVDLSKSPKSMLKGLGTEAVREVKSKMQAYASQLRAFFKKLNF